MSKPLHLIHSAFYVWNLQVTRGISRGQFFTCFRNEKFISTLQIYLRRSEDIFEQHQVISRLKKSDALSRPQSEKTRQADRRTAQCNFHRTKRNPVEIDDGCRRVTRGSWLSVSRPDSSWLHSTLSTQCTCTMLSGVHRERVRDQSGPFVRSFLQTSFWTDKSVRQHEGQATLRY